MGVAKRLSWSHTRSKLWNSCKRKLFYQYYSADEAFEDVVRCQKLLTCPQMLVGDVVHFGIHTYLQRLKDFGERVENLEELCINKYNLVSNASFSTVARLRKTPRNRRDTDKPFHHHWYRYELPGNPTGRSHDAIRMNIRTFLSGSLHDYLMEVGPESWTLTKNEPDDIPPSFTLPNTDLQIYVNHDLSVVQQAEFHIIDWKTGKQTEQTVSDAIRQLAVYSLHAESLGHPIDSIFNQAVFLKNTGEHEPIRAMPQLMAQMRRAAITEHESELRSVTLTLDDDGRDVFLAKITDFPAQPEPKRCFYCNFREKCLVGQSAASRLGQDISDEDGLEEAI